ncbi:ATP-binding protein [Actinopolymorpha pittospori]
MTTDLTLLSRVSFRDQEIAGPRLRALLALLAVDLRAGASTTRLVDGLWADDQPENPTKALQVLVSRARSQLGSDVIASTPTGYRLALGENQVDASAVLLRLAASGEQSRAGDHAAALEQAEQGLALWDGAAGGDVVLDDPLSALRADRVSTYRSLGRARALALSRLGRRAEALDELASLAAESPRDEEVLLELLRCEAATVGPAAALARYDTYRRSLRDDLGTDPGPALRAEYEHLLRGEAPVIRQGVPHEPNPLLGRDEDIAAVAKLIRTSRVTSIVGPGGLGKTRLAYSVSREAEQRIVHVVPLAGVTAAGDVLREVATVLGAGEARRMPVGPRTAPPDHLASIVSALGPDPALLVLDNCEHVLDGATELVRALVSMAQDLRVLTTSRAPLGLSSESVYALPELDRQTTVELFEQRARAARPGVDLPAEVVADLCRHLDGLPLAAELAAARVRVMSVAEIAQRLNDRFSLLRGGARDAPRRHQTLHAVVDWSWNLLDPQGQAAMRTLSIFPDGFTEDAAQHLLGDEDILFVLEHLVDQSLLKVADTPSGTRFRMLETVREFSAARRESAGEADLVTERFLAWARDFGIAHHESTFTEDPFSPAWQVRAEQDNLVQAFRLGLERSDGATIAATSAALGGLWSVESNYARLPALAESVWPLSHYRPEPEYVEITRAAAVLNIMCVFLLYGGTGGRELFILRRLPPAPPDTVTRAAATVIAASPDLMGAGLARLDELCRSDQPLVAMIANVVATYGWEHGGEPGKALRAAERMLAASNQNGAPWARLVAHSRIGELALQAGRGDLAERHFKEALKVLAGQQWPDLFKIRWALVLANVQRGALDEAEHWLGLAGTPREDLTDMATFDLGVRAEIQLARGNVEAGLAQWRHAVDEVCNRDAGDLGFRLESVGLHPWALQLLSVAVVAHTQHGRLDLAATMADQLPEILMAMLSAPVDQPPAYYVDGPVHGVLLLALALADLDGGRRSGDVRALRSGARMIALAERFGYPRDFSVTMSATRVRQAAEDADRSAYQDAVSSYADLDRDALLAAALAALHERPEPEA